MSSTTPNNNDGEQNDTNGPIRSTTSTPSSYSAAQTVVPDAEGAELLTEMDGQAIAAAIVLGEVEKAARRRVQIISFCCAMLNCLCAGSLILFSLWAPVFQETLGFTQMQINAVSIAGELGMYLPVPIFGWICDRYGPAKLSILSSLFFGPSYLLAAHAFTNDLPFYVMLIAFIFIGCGTSSMYFAGVTTCAKNFTGESRGIALALPIAAFGLSSLWEAQFVSRVFKTNKVIGGIDIVSAFVFFAGLLTVVGVLGGVGLRILPEECKLEQVRRGEEEEGPVAYAGEESSLLGGSGVATPSYMSYGTTPQEVESEVRSVKPSGGWFDAETKAFLADRTMWWFAIGVFLVTGPGESFINNMGTLIKSLYTPEVSRGAVHSIHHIAPISTATHVSIIAFTSTLARLIAGSLSDYLAPVVPVTGTEAASPAIKNHRKPTLSRMYLLMGFALLMAFAQVFVAMGGVDQRGDRFWMVSGAMGAGYGAVFTLAPTIVSVVWGTERFGTNWGIITVTPAIGATVFGVVFAVGYDGAAKRQKMIRDGLFWASKKVVAQSVCYGRECYSTAFWIMGASVLVACGFWMLAWKGKGGWRDRKIAV